MRLLHCRLIVALSLTGVGISVQADPKPPSKSDLAAIRLRGTELAAYDYAAWHATDKYTAAAPDRMGVKYFVAKREGKQWRVVFGARNERDEMFLIQYEVVGGPSPSDFTLAKNDPPRQDADYFLRASLAIDSAQKAFGAMGRTYNVAALPAPHGRWYVYLYPASTKPGVWPLGGDARYTVSRDGKIVEESRRLHKAIIESDAPGKEGKPAASVHVHVLECIPEDTDVLAVLSRSPSIPEYIICEPFSFAVDEDGKVRYIGITDVIFPDMKDKAKNNGEPPN